MEGPLALRPLNSVDFIASADDSLPISLASDALGSSVTANPYNSTLEGT